MSLTNQAIWYHVITVGTLLTFKLAVLLVGYLIAKLGYQLLLKGVTGEFKFQTEFKGAKADLASVSPGLFFILMAAILIAVGVIKDKPFETIVTTGVVQTSAESDKATKASDGKPTLPGTPQKENTP
jgi:hypothetical protein